MEWQKASATHRGDHQAGSRRRAQDSSSSVRTVVAPSRRRQKAAKSCSPSSGAAAACMPVDVERSRSARSTSWRRSGSGAERRVATR